jgi:hypothetical protein
MLRGWSDDVCPVTADVEPRSELPGTRPDRYSGVLKVEVSAAPAGLDSDGLRQTSVLLQ